MTSADKSKSSASSVLATNRKAGHDYHILEKFEAGLELRGAEVKSIRERRVSLAESFARVEDGEVILHNLHIQPYSHQGGFSLDPVRPRRLLLHKSEILKLHQQVAQQSRTLIPLSLYLKRGRVKVQLALCAGKAGRDKRETLRRKTAEREAQRAIAYHKKS